MGCVWWLFWLFVYLTDGLVFWLFIVLLCLVWLLACLCLFNFVWGGVGLVVVWLCWLMLLCSYA